MDMGVAVVGVYGPMVGSQVSLSVRGPPKWMRSGGAPTPGALWQRGGGGSD